MVHPLPDERLTNITYTRLHPVLNTGKAKPSKESREHSIWDENNLLTVSGGKLTTFRIMARDALKAAHRHLAHIHFQHETPVLEPIPPENEALRANSSLPAALFASACSSDLEPVPATPYLWAEIGLVARAESVLHPDDSFLRRVGLGLLAPNRGSDLLPRVRAIVQSELGWNDAHWEEKVLLVGLAEMQV